MALTALVLYVSFCTNPASPFQTTQAKTAYLDQCDTQMNFGIATAFPSMIKRGNRATSFSFQELASSLRTSASYKMKIITFMRRVSMNREWGVRPIVFADVARNGIARQIYTRNPIGFKSPTIPLETPTYRYHQQLI